MHKWERAPRSVKLEAHPGSEYAGCAEAPCSTTGAVAILVAEGLRAPLSSKAMAQRCVSRSTGESDTVATDTSLRMLTLPAGMILYDIVGVARVSARGDNRAMFHMREAARSPTLRHLARAQGVSVAWSIEMYRDEQLDCVYAKSETMVADVFTMPHSHTSEVER